jgi:hypothetical protein
MEITVYNRKDAPMTDPVKVQFRSADGKLWKIGSPGSWEVPANVAQAETLLELAVKDTKSNHWVIGVPDALITSGQRFVDMLLYDADELEAITLGGILGTKSGHWYDPSQIPLDRVNRLPVSQGPV